MKKVFVTVSSKGQMVIPAGIRDELGIQAGTRIAVSSDGTRVILEAETLAAKLRQIEEIRGCTAGQGSGTDMLLEDRRRERERERLEEGW
jgi:AbrB family looped-hinge helix DNA binding protein